MSVLSRKEFHDEQAAYDYVESKVGGRIEKPCCEDYDVDALCGAWVLRGKPR